MIVGSDSTGVSTLRLRCFGALITPLTGFRPDSKDSLYLASLQKWDRQAFETDSNSLEPGDVIQRRALLEEETAALQSFTTTFANSPWTAPIQAQLGQVYRLTGRYSLALQQWEAAYLVLLCYE